MQGVFNMESEVNCQEEEEPLSVEAKWLVIMIHEASKEVNVLESLSGLVISILGQHDVLYR